MKLALMTDYYFILDKTEATSKKIKMTKQGITSDKSGENIKESESKNVSGNTSENINENMAAIVVQKMDKIIKNSKK